MLALVFTGSLALFLGQAAVFLIVGSFRSRYAAQQQRLPLVGFMAAILTGFLLWHATQLIEMIPRFVIGSAVAYVGVTFLFDWVIKPAKRLSTVNYAAVLFMVVLFVSLGQQI